MECKYKNRNAFGKRMQALVKKYSINIVLNLIS